MTGGLVAYNAFKNPAFFKAVRVNSLFALGLLTYYGVS